MENNFPEMRMFPEILTARAYNSRNYLSDKTADRVTDFFEVGVYLENSGVLYIDGSAHEIKRGSIRFIKPGSRVSSSPHYTSLSLVMRFGEDGTSYDRDIIDEIPQFFYGGDSLIPAFSEIIELFSLDEKCSKLKMNSLACSLLHDIYFLSKNTERYSSAVIKCTEYIKEHYSENVTLETLGSITGYVPLHVLRIFKNQTGQTPHEFLTSTRMANAKTLLDRTTFSIAQIATMCGFNSASHFQTLFKKIFGISPGKYRKNPDLRGI